MSSLRDKLVYLKHNSKILTLVWYYGRQPMFKYKNRKLEREAEKRRNGYEDERYIGLKQYKNIHDGKRCFIIATGPSLKVSDLEMLKDEYTFGMNSICKLYDDISWRPTYYGIQDSNVYEKLQSVILDVYSEKKDVFIGSGIASKYPIPDNFQQFPWNGAYHDNELEVNNYFSKFSDDCYSIVYDGYSITYSLIQIAIYMGFKEIYLLGADCSYKKGEKNHVVESGFIDKNEEKNYDKMITGYKSAKEYAEKSGVKIINCTRGGMLEVYERKSLEEVLDSK